MAGSMSLASSAGAGAENSSPIGLRIAAGALRATTPSAMKQPKA